MKILGEIIKDTALLGVGAVIGVFGWTIAELWTEADNPGLISKMIYECGKNIRDEN